MKIVNLKTDQLIPYVNNPRHNEDAVDAVASSIAAFGFNVPIVLDKDRVIITGHTRRLAAIKLGLETVPCIIADHLTPAQVQAFRLADNRVAEISTWDDELLQAELDQLAEAGIDMSDYFTDEELAGFDLKNILGKSCILTISNSKSADGKTYTNVTGIAKLMKGMQPVELEKEPLCFDLDSATLDDVDNLPNWIGDQVKKSVTYQQMLEAEEKADQGVQFTDLDDESELPF